jgi:hypothetical protein
MCCGTRGQLPRARQPIGKVLRTLPMGVYREFLLFGSFILKRLSQQKAAWCHFQPHKSLKNDGFKDSYA